MKLAVLFDRLGEIGEPLVRPIATRLNPILVKEIRQSLRGRYFQVAFSLMVILAIVVACIVLVLSGLQADEPDGGVHLFIGMYVLLSIAVHVFVPFQAFLSVGSEWEENTFDLLVLSNLTPMQIVLGKLYSAQIQVLLFYCAFGPFLVFAFLLRGLDLVTAIWILGLTLISSTGLICVALCLSSLVTNKFGRVLMMVLQTAVLLVSCGWSIAGSGAAFFQRFVHTPEFVQVALILISLTVAVASFCLVLAATRFTHPEENRSTGLRILTTIGVLVGISWMIFLYYNYRQIELLLGCSLGLFAAITVLAVPFCAEEERLGRRVRLHVPRGRLTAFLVQPFLPGGARGVLLFFTNLALVLIALALIRVSPLWTPGSLRDERMVIYPLGMLFYLAIYLLLPTVLFSRWTRKLTTRVVARVMVPATALLAGFLPILGGFLLGSRPLSRGNHYGNPVWVLETAHDATGIDPVLAGVFFFMLFVVALNLPRIVRGFRELERARVDVNQRRLSEQRDGVPES